MYKSIIDKIDKPIFYWIVIGIAVILGAIIRFKGLGTWPLALDEYYIIKSCEYILEYGYPQFPNGGYYVRGILLQYLIAPLLSFGIKAEFAGRVYTVIANIITIPAIYLIAKRVSNQLVATVIVLIFSFSIWEIEFARFARMYTPFQAIFTWYIYFALIDYENRNFSNFTWLILLSVISSFVYEGSIFLAVFNFVPFVLNRKIKVSYLISAIFTFVLSAFINMFDFRTLNSNPILPPQFSETIKLGLASSPIKLPQILLPFSFDSVISSISLIILVVINFYFLWKLLKIHDRADYWSKISLIILTMLAVLNQFGLFFLIFILMVFWSLLDINVSRRKIFSFLSIIGLLNFIYWFSFGLLSDSWYKLFDDFSSYSIWGISKRLFVGFFNYPDNYYTLYNYFEALPFLTIISSIISLALIIFLILNNKSESRIKFIFGSIIFVSILSTIPTLMYQETRYTFFAVPLLILSVNYALYIFIEKIFKKNNTLLFFCFPIVALIIFLISNDFNYYHLTNIDKADVNYRMIYSDSEFRKHLYRRWDIETPTNYVSENAEEDDLIMINENSHAFYLPRVDYYSFDYKHRAFIAISVEEGKKERWSNARLINNNEALLNFLENSDKTIWFTVYPENYLYDISFYQRFKEFEVSRGIDNVIKVYKFPPQSLKKL